MTKGIKAKDIRDFEKHARKLGEVINRIREYKDGAHIYVTPQQFNLMADEFSGQHGRIRGKEENPTVTSVFCSFLDGGDW